MNVERSINHLPKKVRAVASAAFLATALSGCSGNVAPEPSSTYSPIPSPTETATPESTYPPIEPAQTFPYPTTEPVPTADPKIPCDPRLVPDAKTVVPFNSELPKDFVLYVPVLEYHLIDTLKGGVAQTDGIKSGSSLVVSPAIFRAQMELLHKNGWHTITMAELAKAWVTRTAVPKKTFVITFDDGHRDGIENADPILKNLGYVATFYDITGRTYDAAHKTGNPAQLSNADLFTLTQEGNDIGNHSVHHLQAATRSTAKGEVYNASIYIAADTGIWPSSMAYPFGSEGTYEPELAQCPSLIFGLVQQPNPNVPAAFESYANRRSVPRIKIYPSTSPARLLYMLNHLNQDIAPKPTPKPNPTETAAPTPTP